MEIRLLLINCAKRKIEWLIDSGLQELLRQLLVLRRHHLLRL